MDLHGRNGATNDEGLFPYNWRAGILRREQVEKIVYVGMLDVSLTIELINVNH